MKFNSISISIPFQTNSTVRPLPNRKNCSPKQISDKRDTGELRINYSEWSIEYAGKIWSPWRVGSSMLHSYMNKVCFLNAWFWPKRRFILSQIFDIEYSYMNGDRWKCACIQASHPASIAILCPSMDVASGEGVWSHACQTERRNGEICL